MKINLGDNQKRKHREAHKNVHFNPKFMDDLLPRVLSFQIGEDSLQSYCIHCLGHR
jgi:hypothetical protein